MIENATLWKRKYPKERAKRTVINGIGLYDYVSKGLINRAEGTNDYLFVHLHTPCQVWYDGTLHSYPKDAFVIFPPNSKHLFGNEEVNWCYSWLHCDGKFVESLLNKGLIREGLPYKMTSSRLNDKYLLQIREELQLFSNYDREIVECILTIWLRSLNRALYIPGISPIPDRMQKASAYIGQHFSQKLSLADIGVVAGLGQSQLIQEFKKYFGKTPIEYLMHTRLDRAATLLRDGNHTISQISFQLGFCNPFYFSKQFKGAYGVSPKGFRIRERAQRQEQATEA
ncbi:MAG: AraC family transcriptional regulator [Bacteroidota bacterium]